MRALTAGLSRCFGLDGHCVYIGFKQSVQGFIDQLMALQRRKPFKFAGNDGYREMSPTIARAGVACVFMAVVPDAERVWRKRSQGLLNEGDTVHGLGQDGFVRVYFSVLVHAGQEIRIGIDPLAGFFDGFERNNQHAAGKSGITGIFIIDGRHGAGDFKPSLHRQLIQPGKVLRARLQALA